MLNFSVGVAWWWLWISRDCSHREGMIVRGGGGGGSSSTGGFSFFARE